MWTPGPYKPAPELMLLDINVPRRTGNQVLERIRNSPRCAHIPVVMISSSDSPAERNRAFKQAPPPTFANLRVFLNSWSSESLVRELHDQFRRNGHSTPQAHQPLFARLFVASVAHALLAGLSKTLVRSM